MRLRLVAVGQRMPAWVTEAWDAYTRRMPPQLAWSVRDIPLARRGSGRAGPAEAARWREEEGQAMLASLGRDVHAVALDRGGRSWSTEHLAEQLAGWQESTAEVAFLVGGPDGLDTACLEAARQRWSLGPLTLPHPLVRVVLAEQIYRAWSLLSGHPYHRG